MLMNTANNFNKMPSTIKMNRKASKPLMEKRRRARINRSLAELKDMIVCNAATQENDNCRRSKMEKADILEMTVRHLQQLHEHVRGATKDAGAGFDPIDTRNRHHLDKFRAGFHRCVAEVTRYLHDHDSKLDVRGHRHLTNHLNSCLERVHVLCDRTQDAHVTQPDDDVATRVDSLARFGHDHLQDNVQGRELAPNTTVNNDYVNHQSHVRADQCPAIPNNSSAFSAQIRDCDPYQQVKRLPDMMADFVAAPEAIVWRPW